MGGRKKKVRERRSPGMFVGRRIEGGGSCKNQNKTKQTNISGKMGGMRTALNRGAGDLMILCETGHVLLARAKPKIVGLSRYLEKRFYPIHFS
jgi:hypothetical protein